MKRDIKGCVIKQTAKQLGIPESEVTLDTHILNMFDLVGMVIMLTNSHAVEYSGQRSYTVKEAIKLFERANEPWN